MPVLTIADGLRSTRLKLWDEDGGRLITFAEARRMDRRAPAEVSSATLELRSEPVHAGLGRSTQTEVAVKGLSMRCAFIGLMASVAALSIPSIAQAQITEVFTDTETPVACEEQTGDDAGIRFCSNFEDPRSTVPTWDGVPIDVNVAFPSEETYGEGPYPVMMLFHGYAGSKLGLGSMRRWLNQGYATFSMTTRGNHQSCGVAGGPRRGWGSVRRRLRPAHGHPLRGSRHAGARRAPR